MDHTSYSLPAGEMLTEDESQQLFELCAKGDVAARERIILAYIPYIIKICRKHEGKGVPLDDLVQEGAYGLIVALDKYDLSRGTSFASHATPFIEKYVKKALISQSVFQPIVYKEDFFYEMQRYIRALDEQTEKLNRTPTDQELAKVLRSTENRIRKLSQSLYCFFPVQDLVAPGIEGGQASSSTEDSVMQHVLDLSSLDVMLSRREREVLSRRFGFTDSGVPEDIAAISAAMGLSYETIRSTYERAIHALREAVKRQGYTVSTIEI